MSIVVSIPEDTRSVLLRHFFQNQLEQGAFLFARPIEKPGELTLVVEEHYLVPKSGWERQQEIYLQMRDAERGKIMKLARDKRLCAIDCHSHPGAGQSVWFSPSDVAGISEFATYAKWKLDGLPFAALVWGEHSVDGVAWHGSFAAAQRVDRVDIIGKSTVALHPTNSWFERPRGRHRFAAYE